MGLVDQQTIPGPNSDQTMSLEDVSGQQQQSADRVEHSQLAGYIRDEFFRSENARRPDETRWLEHYRAYIGEYGPEVEFTEAEKSRTYIKVTKTKVLAAYGQLCDVLFPAGHFPISIRPSKVPIGVAESVHIDPKEPEDAGTGTPEDQSMLFSRDDGLQIPPGATADNISDLLGPFKDELKQLPVKEGPGLTPTSATFHPADVAAGKMEKKILDQLDESDAEKHLRFVAFEAALFGTGFLFGPYSAYKEYPKWDDKGEYTPKMKIVPKVEACSLWDAYPDPDATSLLDCDFITRRRRLSRSQLHGLKKRPYFRPEIIDAAIADGPNYIRKYWEDTLWMHRPVTNLERWEVLEFWGYIDAELAEEAGLEIPDELQDQDQIQVNAWVCGGHLLRLVLNPYTPTRLPCFAIPYELNPYSVFGIGVAENMSDTQQLMNAFMRMAVDNAALAGNLIFEIDETNLSPGQDMRIYPGKIFRRQSGPPGQAIFSQKFQNVTAENMAMFDRAMQLSDVATGIPSILHGQTGVTGTGRTSSGLSMIMGAATISIKTVVRNFDDYLLAPLGKSLFSWNMQFDFDPDIKGDLDVLARGTEGLLKSEVRQQRLMSFLQVVSNPALAPFAKFPYIIREIAKAMDLDPDLVTNNVDEAIRQAQIMALTHPELAQMQQAQANGEPGGSAPSGGEGAPMGPPQSKPGPAAGPSKPPGTSPSGNGNGTAAPSPMSMPGEKGFTGNAP